MKLAIIGSRTFNDYDILDRAIKQHYGAFKQYLTRWEYDFDEIVSGGATGADSLGAQWGRNNGIKVTEFLPDWDKWGKRAGFIRNEQIIQAADKVLCFWDGQSKGSGNSLAIAKRLKKETVIVYF